MFAAAGLLLLVVLTVGVEAGLGYGFFAFLCWMSFCLGVGFQRARRRSGNEP